MIDTWDTYFNRLACEMDEGGNHRGAIETRLFFCGTTTEAKERGIKALMLKAHRAAPIGGISTATIRPVVNHGRWLINCPYCNSASYARDDRLFFCIDCQNSTIGGQYVKTPFPKTKKSIERIMEIRPSDNQNWTNESMAELENEGRSNGMDRT